MAMPDLKAFSLEGKIALVTGASHGVAAIACDLSDDAAIRRALGEISQHGDRLDVMINAAGISLPAAPAKDELRRFRDTLATDLTGVYATILAAHPLLKEAA